MITMINNWLVWSLGLFDDWFMKVQSISPLRKWLSSLVVLSWVWKVYGVFSFEIRFWEHFKRYSIVIMIMLVQLHKQFLRVQRNSVLQCDLFGQAVACNLISPKVTAFLIMLQQFLQLNTPPKNTYRSSKIKNTIHQPHTLY